MVRKAHGSSFVICILNVRWKVQLGVLLLPSPKFRPERMILRHPAVPEEGAMALSGPHDIMPITMAAPRGLFSSPRDNRSKMIWDMKHQSARPPSTRDGQPSACTALNSIMPGAGQSRFWGGCSLEGMSQCFNQASMMIAPGYWVKIFAKRDFPTYISVCLHGRGRLTVPE